MTRRAHFAAVLGALLLALPGAFAGNQKTPAGHQFGVIGHSFGKAGGEARLKRALEATSDSELAFVVVTGIKGKDEACSDKLYVRRQQLFDDAARPLIVAPAASDWSECKNSAGRLAAIDRLNRLRELFFSEPASLGASKLALTRLSTSAKFRSYAENAHWEVGNVLYATINLPANNNHYRPEAGRNSEYEDRLVANRFWLNRLFARARREKAEAIVLFSEGDLKALAPEGGLRALLRGTADKQDGFAPTRRQLLTLAQKFPGKVLLIDTAARAGGAGPAIEWRANLGHLSLGSDALQVRVAPGTANLFTVKDARADEKGAPK